MTSDKWFRYGVAIILKQAGKPLYLLGERKDLPGEYSLPQGGISHNEGVIEAAIRELAEETGISAGYHILARLPLLTVYEIPRSIREKHPDKYGIGQVHSWVMFEMDDYLDAKAIRPSQEFSKFDFHTAEGVCSWTSRSIKADIYKRVMEAVKRFDRIKEV